MKATPKRKMEYSMNATENCICEAFRSVCYDILKDLPQGDIHDKISLLLRLSEETYSDFMIEAEEWEYGRC